MRQRPDMALWQGRRDPEEGERAKRWHQCIAPLREGSPRGIVVAGVCSDEGVRRNQGRPGARGGPEAIRRAMANQAFHLERPLYDGGNLLCPENHLEDLAQEQARWIEGFLHQGHFPIILGGGHEIALGNYLGLSRHLAKNNPAPSIGIVNFDAHFDLRQGQAPTSGTPFRQVAEYCWKEDLPFLYFCLGISETANTAALFDRAEALGVQYLKDEELTPWNLALAEARLREFLTECDALYLSIDLDVLPGAVAPGVSAPAIRGVSLEVLEHLLRFLRSEAGAKLKLADLAECNPEDDPDGRTARVAARLAHLLAREVPAPVPDKGVEYE
ncbi:formimidoylglutamase [Desulfuromonas versatilis]|uniref:Formimidoylglutamase n=1 Tax=Desulfuromonas versatilis TaxID=2802975 RepID=A0ABM8HVB7_9BACT|nr:formimidoylglutamase [Desulfuromonas versatilis]BCR04624.1 formimidoylglutamase [Desulfuromonas versatilis]